MSAPPSVDGLEAQCQEFANTLSMKLSRQTRQDIARDVTAFIRTRNREREREIRELRGWKESAMKLFKAFDSQAVGKALGLQLGESVMDKVLPAILAMQAADRELVEKLEGTTQTIQEFEAHSNESGDPVGGCVECLRLFDALLKRADELRAVLAARNEGGTK